MQNALQKNLGAPTSNTMPVDPRKQIDVDGEWMKGAQAGQDMSWMTKPGAVTAGSGQAFAPQTFTGFAPKYAMEGFDTAREQDTGKSAKDAFAYLSNQAPPPPINDKAKLGAWFSQYIQPGMDALGHKVLSVDGDTFRFKNWQGEYDVDYGRGAGAEDGALAWQATDANAPPVLGANRGTSHAMPSASGVPGQQSDLMAQILAALEQDQQVDPQALFQRVMR